MKFEDQRKLMVNSQLVNRGISDTRIINAFLKVPRHEFVPKEIQNLAYKDSALGIGDLQTISQPFIVATMMQFIDLNENDVVLEIGTGSGYQTALLAEIAKEVYTVERIDNLYRKAKKVIKQLGYSNIHYRVGDGTKGWEKAYPVRDQFDKIIVSAGSPKIPDALINQLAENGKLVIPCGNKQIQELIVLTKTDGKINEERLGGCTFVPLIGDDGWEN